MSEASTSPEAAELIRQICGTDLNGGLIRDLCFTVWSICHNPTHEDGNADWGNDTLPTVQAGVAKVRNMLRAALTSPPKAEAGEPVDALASPSAIKGLKIDREALRRQIERDPDEGEIGVGFELADLDEMERLAMAALPAWARDEILRLRALTSPPKAGAGEPVLDQREIEMNQRSHLRVVFRKALAELPEIAPPEIRSLLSSAHMRDEFLAEGKRLQREHGLDAVAPRVEQECGAGAWSFMRKGVLSAKDANPEPRWDGVRVTDEVLRAALEAWDKLAGYGKMERMRAVLEAALNPGGRDAR